MEGTVKLWPLAMTISVDLLNATCKTKLALLENVFYDLLNIPKVIFERLYMEYMKLNIGFRRTCLKACHLRILRYSKNLENQVARMTAKGTRQIYFSSSIL